MLKFYFAIIEMWFQLEEIGMNIRLMAPSLQTTSPAFDTHLRVVGQTQFWQNTWLAVQPLHGCHYDPLKGVMQAVQAYFPNWQGVEQFTLILAEETPF